jgi:hypothetical protein
VDINTESSLSTPANYKEYLMALFNTGNAYMANKTTITYRKSSVDAREIDE